MDRVAVVGCGYWGVNYIRIFSELESSEVAAVCEPNPDLLARARNRFGGIPGYARLEDLLSEARVDCAVVATPAHTHHELARACLNAGCPVLLEKPLTLRVDHAEELIALARKKGLALMVGHTFLFNAGVRKLKEVLAAPDFGKVYYLHATRTNLGPIRADVNAAWDLAPHDISIFNHLLDRVPTRVSAVGTRVLGGPLEDVVFLTLDYGEGVIGNVHVSWVDPNKVREVVVVGSRKRVVFDDLNSLERIRIFEKGVAASPEPGGSLGFGEYRFMVRDGDILSPRVDVSEPLKNECEHFLACLHTGDPPLTDGRAGLDVVRVLAAADRSIASGGAPEEV